MRGSRAVLGLTLSLLLLSTPALAGFTEDFTFDASSLTVGNLIGQVTVEGTTGSDFEIVVEVDGDDAEPDLIRFEQHDGRDAELFVVFPVEDHQRYVYPGMGRGRTQIRLRRHEGGNTNWLDALLGGSRGEKIEVRGGGRGLELWADVTIRVPEGKELTVFHGVGEVEANDVVADLTLDVSSGSILARGIEGVTILDTGSGHIRAASITGPLSVDTGSGHVEVDGCEGAEVRIDTGSGHVELLDCTAEVVSIDTGSGHVRLDKVDCEDLEVDTGSGGVDGREVAADRAMVDTGSGSVELELVRMGDGPYDIDTGSGGITLEMPDDASADITAESSGGRVSVDVRDAVMHHQRRDEAEFEVGNGDARVSLSTGSGGIRIRQR